MKPTPPRTSQGQPRRVPAHASIGARRPVVAIEALDHVPVANGESIDASDRGLRSERLASRDVVCGAVLLDTAGGLLPDRTTGLVERDGTEPSEDRVVCLAGQRRLASCVEVERGVTLDLAVLPLDLLLFRWCVGQVAVAVGAVPRVNVFMLD